MAFDPCSEENKRFGNFYKTNSTSAEQDEYSRLDLKCNRYAVGKLDSCDICQHQTDCLAVIIGKVLVHSVLVHSTVNYFSLNNLNV